MQQISTAGRARRAELSWWAWLAAMTALAAVVGLGMLLQGPSLVVFAWAVFLAGIAAIFYRPHFGVYLVTLFTLMGDSYLAWEYPFAKNFSSRESIFFLGRGLIFSPLELYIALTFLSWFLRWLGKRELNFYRGPLFWQMAAFMLFVVTGLAYGILKGGDRVVALWEVRPIVYLFAMFLLTSNLFYRREHVLRVMWLVTLGMAIIGITGTYIFLVVLKGSIHGVNQITEHSAAIQINSVFIFAIGLWFYKASLGKRLTLMAALPFLVITYLATQRRAAFLTMMLALVLIALLVYLEHRRLFWLAAPPLAVLGIAYIIIFWNASGTLALPVDALKSVVAPSAATLEDQSSNAYRIVENMNLSFTLHQRPLTGIGFGQKFYLVVPMPDISFFEWWQYLPHNSIVWIWLKTGLFGFVAMLFLVTSAIMQGAQLLRRAPRNELSAALLAMTLYLFMHFIYAYVDISWDAKSMIYVGMVMGVFSRLPAIMAEAAPPPARRWPWQPEPQAEPGLLPMPGEAPAAEESRSTKIREVSRL